MFEYYKNPLDTGEISDRLGDMINFEWYPEPRPECGEYEQYFSLITDMAGAAGSLYYDCSHALRSDDARTFLGLLESPLFIRRYGDMEFLGEEEDEWEPDEIKTLRRGLKALEGLSRQEVQKHAVDAAGFTARYLQAYGAFLTVAGIIGEMDENHKTHRSILENQALREREYRRTYSKITAVLPPSLTAEAVGGALKGLGWDRDGTVMPAVFRRGGKERLTLGDGILECTIRPHEIPGLRHRLESLAGAGGIPIADEGERYDLTDAELRERFGRMEYEIAREILDAFQTHDEDVYIPAEEKGPILSRIAAGRVIRRVPEGSDVEMEQQDFACALEAVEGVFDSLVDSYKLYTGRYSPEGGGYRTEKVIPAQEQGSGMRMG